jgi:hypothetical protein
MAKVKARRAKGKSNPTSQAILFIKEGYNETNRVLTSYFVFTTLNKLKENLLGG